MTLIIGARCQDGIILAADRRRMSKYERGPSTTKLFALSCGVAIAGAGDDAVLNEARIFIDRRIKEMQTQTSVTALFDVVEAAAVVVNELVSFYKGSVEEPFGYVVSGLENLTNGKAQLYTVFGAGISDVPWVCLGSGSSYARPLVDLVLAPGNLYTNEAAKIIPTIFTLVSNVQTTVGDGIDICVVVDDQGVSDISHKKEVSLDRLRSVFLSATNVAPYKEEQEVKNE
jgi:20S proteasome alpha/beta subunit